LDIHSDKYYKFLGLPYMHDKYVALTPVNTADSDGHYSEAIEAALKNDDVMNIALTGPYGSGKSSIIKSFEKRNSSQTRDSDKNNTDTRKSYSFLNISLASFSESEEKPDDILIERSILQQMIYGIPSKSIPLSRFKTINMDALENIKAYLFVSWLFTILMSVNIIFSDFFSNYISIDSFISVVVITLGISGFILQFFDVFRQFNRQSM
jgi:hypothetical protein